DRRRRTVPALANSKACPARSAKAACPRSRTPEIRRQVRARIPARRGARVLFVGARSPPTEFVLSPQALLYRGRRRDGTIGGANSRRARAASPCESKRH